MANYNRARIRAMELLHGAKRPATPTDGRDRNPATNQEEAEEVIAALKQSMRDRQAQLCREREERIRDFGDYDSSEGWIRVEPAVFRGQPIRPVAVDPGWPVDDDNG